MEGISWIIVGGRSALELKNFSSIPCFAALLGSTLKGCDSGYLEFSKFLDGIVFPSLYNKFNLIEHQSRVLAITDLFLSPLDEYMDELKTGFSNLSVVGGPVNPLNAVSEERCKVWYVRFGTQFLVGVCGRYKHAVYIRNFIQKFLSETLLLTLNKDQPKIIHLVKNNARSRPILEFLGYGIGVSGRPSALQLVIKPELLIPKKVINEWLIGKGLANPEGRGKYVGKWVFLPDAEIIRRFNNVLKDLVKYYEIVNKSSKQLSEAAYIIKYSLLHTIAAKHRMRINQVIRKYTIDQVNKKLGVKLDNGKRIITFYEPVVWCRESYLAGHNYQTPGMP